MPPSKSETMARRRLLAEPSDVFAVTWMCQFRRSGPIHIRSGGEVKYALPPGGRARRCLGSDAIAAQGDAYCRAFTGIGGTMTSVLAGFGQASRGERLIGLDGFSAQHDRSNA